MTSAAGRTLDERALLPFTVKDGRIVEVHHPPEQPVLDEFYSERAEDGDRRTRAESTCGNIAEM